MNYITRAGYDKISQQIKQLYNIDVANAIHDIERARENGRLDENEEFHQAKAHKEQIENRIEDLRTSLAAHEIFNGVITTDVIGFGSCATIEDENGKVRTLTIVSSLEPDLKLGRVSTASPIGSSLIGCKVGEIIEVETPSGTISYEILSITKGNI